MFKKIMAFPVEMKSVGDMGYFAGYASMFDFVDNQMDVVTQGSFSRTLADKSDEIKLLWQHDPREPIGYFTNIVEDEHGLYVEGYIQQEVARGREAYALLKSGAVRGLSIGYNVKDYSVDNKTGVRAIHDLDLHEISLVTFPANEMAKVIQVKSESEVVSLIDRIIFDLDEIELKRRNGFNPDQPRVPSGNSDGGQWTTGANGGTRLNVTIRPDPIAVPDVGADLGDAGGTGSFFSGMGVGFESLLYSIIEAIANLNSMVGFITGKVGEAEVGKARVALEDFNNGYDVFEAETFADDEGGFEQASAISELIMKLPKPPAANKKPGNYPVAKVGEPIIVPDKNGNIPSVVNIFVGGGGDQGINHNVSKSNSLNRDVSGTNYYYTHDDTFKIEKLVDDLYKQGVKPNIIGHSLGGAKAAQIALSRSGKINNLITVDPVGEIRLGKDPTSKAYIYGRPDYKLLKNSVINWVNINAGTRSNSLSAGNGIAIVGGKWGDDPQKEASLFIKPKLDHAEFDGMLNWRGNSGLSSIEILNDMYNEPILQQEF